jgi:eukaryotic translation initiation factor 2C
MHATLKAKLGFVRLIIVILPDDRADNYGNVKTWADNQAGVYTICIIPGNAASLSNAAFQANIALKVNAKLGGRNHVVAPTSLHRENGKGTMVMGADVTRPGVGSVPHCPSVAAVVASIDRFAAIYPGSLRLQKSKQETIEELADMVQERLALWHKKNKSLPSDILFYRDGISDSQFAAVKVFELPKIRDGCDAAGQKVGISDYKPGITLVVCNKRHHTRVYPSVKASDHEP